MMPSSVAMFFMMDQLSLLRPAEDKRAMGPAHGKGAQPSEAAIPPQWPSAQDSASAQAPRVATTAELSREGAGEYRGELQPPSEEGRSRVVR